jgi:hypothetical protein
MTTYTIIDGEGYVLDRGVSLNEAADAIMTSDSREWEIRQDKDGGFTAWSRQQVASRPWAATAIYFKMDRAEAEHEIYEKIVTSDRWPGHCEAMTDAAYDRMIAEMDADAED